MDEMSDLYLVVSLLFILHFAAYPIHLDLPSEVINVLFWISKVDFHLVISQQGTLILLYEINSHFRFKISFSIKLGCLHECLTSSILGT
jgi:hypothetical protein